MHLRCLKSVRAFVVSVGCIGGSRSQSRSVSEGQVKLEVKVRVRLLEKVCTVAHYAMAFSIAHPGKMISTRLFIRCSNQHTCRH